MREFFGQITLLLIGLIVELGVPLFLSKENQKRVVRGLGVLVILVALVWFGLGLRQYRETTTPSQELTGIPPTPTNTPISPSSTSIPLPITPISPGTSYNGTIASGEVDDYSFVTHEEILVTITVQPIRAFPLFLQILYLDGRKVLKTAKPFSGQKISLTFAPERDVEYIIRVESYWPRSTGSYVISISAND